MNVNFNFENGQISYVYSNYKIEKIRDRKYILPEKKATQNAISLTENIDKKLLDKANSIERFLSEIQRKYESIFKEK